MLANMTTTAPSTRDRILDTALRVFAKTGYYGTSLRDIAAECNLTHPALLYHFGNKADLLAAVLERRDTLDLERMQFADITADNADQMLVDLVLHNVSVPGLAQLHTQLAAEATDPEHPAHAWVVNRYRALHERSKQAFIGRGMSEEQVDAEVTLMIAMIDGLQVQWLLDPERVDMAALITHYLARLADRAH